MLLYINQFAPDFLLQGDINKWDKLLGFRETNLSGFVRKIAEITRSDVTHSLCMDSDVCVFVSRQILGKREGKGSFIDFNMTSNENIIHLIWLQNDNLDS